MLNPKELIPTTAVVIDPFLKGLFKMYRLTCSQRSKIKRNSIVLSLIFVSLVWGRLAAAESVTLNLVDAEIRSVISTISEATGKNFLVDPRVKGKVTLISGIPLDQEALYDVFLTILEVHGFAAIEGDGIVKIVPQNMAKQAPIPTGEQSKGFTGAQKVTKILRLRYVSAAKLIPVLRPLVPKEGHMAAYIPANALIISDSAGNIARLERIIASIDKPTNSSIEVVQLQKASAEKVVQMLKTLQRGKGKSADSVIAVADERTNSVLLSGANSSRVLMRSIIHQLDAPVDSTSFDHVVYLNHAIAKDLAPLLNKTINSKAKRGNAKKGINNSVASVQADEATNALIISASPDQYESLLSIIKKLDIRRAQVMVEAIIVDLDASKAKELGFQLASLGSDGSVSGGIVSQSSGTGATIGGVVATAVAGGIPVFGDGLTFLGGTRNFALMFKALEADADTNILSTPSILTLDNSEAEIIVGKNVPFLTGSFTSTGTSASNPFQTIERKDIGLTLRIKPHINAGDVVHLEISQEVSSISPSTEGAADLVTNKRSIKTTVLINNGEIISLGGLIDDQVTESEQAVPYLSRIPFIGGLFRSTSTEVTKRMLMIFLRPSIIRNDADSRALTRKNYEEIRNRQIKIKQADPERDARYEYPLLPELITPSYSKPSSSMQESSNLPGSAPALSSPAQ